MRKIKQKSRETLNDYWSMMQFSTIARPPNSQNRENLKQKTNPYDTNRIYESTYTMIWLAFFSKDFFYEIVFLTPSPTLFLYSGLGLFVTLEELQAEKIAQGRVRCRILVRNQSLLHDGQRTKISTHTII